jgi:hypothetical protein
MARELTSRLLTSDPMDQTETNQVKATVCLADCENPKTLEATLLGTEGMRITLPSGSQRDLPYIRRDKVKCIQTSPSTFYLQGVVLDAT